MERDEIIRLTKLAHEKSLNAYNDVRDIICEGISDVFHAHPEFNNTIKVNIDGSDICELIQHTGTNIIVKFKEERCDDGSTAQYCECYLDEMELSECVAVFEYVMRLL